ncbi:alpha/beta hydrolase family protein [Lysobacter auxotrophicus]|uniref:S9 family peptidase n=1 Tax=Lysobacter auxotrophicus TaxID=2992573 RepID=A0ABM8DFM6_9GAMM|nr:S9 family peptidase [Lysobacter auxotrophicus]BDU17399.1 S9 family peptidase [Lysobacter auxotrophicus]
MKGFVVAATLALAAWSASAQQAPTLEEFLRKPEFESMTLSPGGDYLAARIPFEDRTLLTILRVSDMKVTAKLDPGRDGFIDSEQWISSTRVLASASMKFGTMAQPYQLPNLHPLDVDGTSGAAFGAYLIDPLPDDPDFVLTAYCYKVLKNECWIRARKMRKTGVGKREDLVDAPVPDASFLADRIGTIRFSWASDNDDRQQVFLLRDGKWESINDENVSGVEITPIGTSFDRRFGFLRSERKQGPDVIERIDLATAERTVVASDANASPQALVWSFDGHEPIGAVYGGVQPQVRFFDEKHPHAALARDLIANFPGEFARVTSASRDGRRAVVTVTSPVEPPRFYLLDTVSGDLKLLARSRPWLSKRAMRPVQAFEFKARDGLTLHGWLNVPAGNGPHPLVVMPHGGPFEISDSWAFADDVQMLATRGYAVLRLNFRGSGGRGRDFVEAGHRQWGRAMQDDLTDATRWAIEHAGVDASRICIWGESYGGYAALMGAVREPALYRCVVGMAGPYDLPTMFRWGDTHRSKWGRTYLTRALGDDMARLREDSPTAHADKIRAQVMLVQGMRDYRVSPEHLHAMRRSLDQAGVKYEGYFPSDETHGFYDDKSRLKYYDNVLRFLDRNLAPVRSAGSGDAGGVAVKVE